MFFYKNKPYFEKFSEWVLAIFIFLFPFIFNIGYMFYGTTSRAINLVVVIEILAIILAISLLSKDRALKVAKSPITLSLFLFLVILFISGITGVDFQTSFWSRVTRMTGIFYFLHLGLFYFFLLNIFDSEKKKENLVKIFLVAAGLFSIGALLSRDGLEVLFTGKPWEGFTFGNSSFAAMYVYAAFMLSFYYVFGILGKGRAWWTNFIPLIFVLNPYFISKDFFMGAVNVFRQPGLVIGEAKASAFTVVFSIILLGFSLLIYKKVGRSSVRKKIIWLATILSILIAVFSIKSFLSDGGLLREQYLKSASSARPIVWELSFEAIREKPLLGWGTDNFNRAFEQNYDTRLLEDKNGPEPWFDRAHNVFIDQTVENGYVGLAFYVLIYIAIIGSCIYVLLNTKEEKEKVLATILTIYFTGHIVELQTAFDTTISFMPLMFMTALAADLFHKFYKSQKGIEKTEISISATGQKVIGGLLLGGVIYLFTIGTVPIIKAHSANRYVREVASSEGRIKYYNMLFGSPVDVPTFLWRTVTDFQRGVANSPQTLEDPQKVQNFSKEVEVFQTKAEQYLAENKMNYRLHLTLANLHIYKRLLGVDELVEAQRVLDSAVEIVPQAPQAYWMKAVGYLYATDFDKAQEMAKKAYDLNPNVAQSTAIINYINESIENFPKITFYNFWQI